MRYTITYLLLLACTTDGLAISNDKDTIVTNLQEVVVEGRTQRVIDSGVEYTPDKNAKKFAIDAISLLENMQIPQLIIFPDNSVKNMDGKNVKIYIDYIEATAADISGLRPEDVRRVEVLDYPKDVRFKNEDHVVNFIMYKYKWGGYTKLRITGGILSEDRIQGGLYQKFIFNDWSFDLAASGRGDWCRNNKDNIKESYKNFEYNGILYDDIIRISETESFYEKNNDEDVSFRFAYGKDDIYVGHTLAFSRQSTPQSERYSNVGFSNPVLSPTNSRDINDALIMNLWVNGNYYFSMPKGNSLSANWSAGINGYRLNRSYIPNGFDPIENHNKTLYGYFWADIDYSKQLAHNNSIGIKAYSNNMFSDTGYTGTYTGDSKITDSYTRAEATYNQRWDFGLSVMARIGVIFIYNRQNGTEYINSWTPRGYIRLGYKFNPKSSISATWNMYTGQPGPDDIKDVIQQENELFWISGNPNLSGGIHNRMNISYNFMPFKIFSMNVTGIYKNYDKVPVYIYGTRPGYDGIVRTLSNDNREQDLTVAASFNLFLLDRSIMFGGGIEFHHQINSGNHAAYDSNVSGFLNVRYSYKNFSTRLFFVSGDRTINDTKGFEHRNPCRYGLNLSYSAGEFKATLQFDNWFSDGKICQEYESPHYDYSGWKWDRNMARMLTLNLTYTFPYGKRVDRNNEIEAGKAGRI